MKPKITIIALGGTIAMSTEDAKSGALPKLSADDLVNAVPQLSDFVQVSTISALNLPSINVRFSHLYQLIETIEKEIKNGQEGSNGPDGPDGIVVTQGTDTIEETSLALYLLHAQKKLSIPIVVTGAMRHPSQISADGPANLLAACQVAASQQAKSHGVLVVLNNEIHSPKYVTKTHSSMVHTFSSTPFAPCGAVIEGVAHFFNQQNLPPLLPIADSITKEPNIPILKPAIGEAPYLAEMLLEQKLDDLDGIVIEAAGAGHIPQDWVKPLHALTKHCPVILASRAKGRILENTYGYEGAEIDLINKGFIPACHLSPLKARVVLALINKKKSLSHKELAKIFAQF